MALKQRGKSERIKKIHEQQDQQEYHKDISDQEIVDSDEETEIDSEFYDDEPEIVVNKKKLSKKVNSYKKQKEFENSDNDEKKAAEKKNVVAKTNKTLSYNRYLICFCILLIAFGIWKIYVEPTKNLENLEKIKHRFNDDSFVTVEYVAKTIDHNTKIPLCLTLFGTNKTELHTIADNIAEIIGPVPDECRIHLSLSSDKENITESISSCVEHKSGQSFGSLVQRLPVVRIHDLDLLSGETPLVFHRYCDGIHSVHAPVFYVNTFTTSAPYLNGQEDITDFAKKNFESIFRDVSIDYSTKVINRLLEHIAVLNDSF